MAGRRNSRKHRAGKMKKERIEDTQKKASQTMRRKNKIQKKKKKNRNNKKKNPYEAVVVSAANLQHVSKAATKQRSTGRVIDSRRASIFMRKSEVMTALR